MKAYRQDFIAIATLVTGDPARLGVADITQDSMRTAFAAYARDHEAASIRRCWSTWNVLCTFLYTGEVLAANPMQLVGRPKLAKPLPKPSPAPRSKHCWRLSRTTIAPSAKSTGLNAISRLSLPHC
jgi:integrase/recombinase XerC